MSASRCDKCGEIVSDIDAGFSPGLHGMGHNCGGTWRVLPSLTGDELDEFEAGLGPEDGWLADQIEMARQGNAEALAICAEELTRRRKEGDE